MRLKRLLLERYGLFKGKVELQFSDSGIDIIVGDNESGKSTLMDGILSTIFGTKREERVNLIPWNEPSSGESLIELKTDKSMKIQRVIETQHTTLTMNQDTEPLVVFSDKASPHGKKEAAHYFDMLNEIFGFSDRSILESLTFLKQNEAETNLDQKIRELISGSGTGDYKKAIDSLKKETLLITRDVFWMNPSKDRLLEDLVNELIELKQALEEALNVRDEGGDVEGELKETEAGLGKLGKKLKTEEVKLDTIKKFRESIEKYERSKKEHDKLLGEIREREKQIKGQEELEAKLSDEFVIQIKEAGGSLRDELNELKGIEQKKKELANEIESLRMHDVESVELLSGGVKAAIVLSVAVIGIIAGQMWNSTQMSALLAFVFGSIAAALLMLLGRKKPVSTDTRLSVRESDLTDLIEKEEELIEKYSNILSDSSIEETLKLIDSVKEWKTELKLMQEIRSDKKPLEELEKESNSLLQTILLTETNLENLEKEYSELLKTERKIGAAEALEAEQTEVITELSTEHKSLEEVKHENEKKIAKHEGRGVGNIDLLNHEIMEKEEEIESKQLESDALQLAVSTLEESAEKFQESHHNRLSEQISEWFERFTGGRYSGVKLDDNWNPEIRTKEGKRIGPQHLSVGARDQLYFAMRLSLAELMSEDVNLPIVLDDPFVNYDDKRLKISIELLKEISKEHQVLLFTHSPEYAKWGNVVMNLNDYWKNMK
ncbi:MAG: AAA family ATPase [Candidatus Marinimicrobia bacterium]|nr:AAA family ATPase [Candidatus Neomarinimicrobiota bacterium]